MRKYSSSILAVLAFAVLTTACSQQADIGITTKVKSLLDTDRSVPNAAQIQVTTENNVVTLAGPVDSPATKARAVAVARKVEGVKKVVDNLTVAPGSVAQAQPAVAPGSDAAQPAAAPGSVAETQPPAAAAAPGTGTATAPTDTAITQAVKEKLLLQPETSSVNVAVDTHEGVVTLSGTVKSPQEKEQVIQTARGTQGVLRVEDKLSVSSS
jgi:hyperosmotically inducible periplasmic protein